MPSNTKREADFTPYSGVARFFHWLTAIVALIMILTGLVMVYRGKDLNIWDDLTNSLYTTHKTLGLALLAIIIARLIYRFVHGAPASEPGLTMFERIASHTTHWMMYVLLIGVPILGWIGISMFPALATFGGFTLPALTNPDNATSKQVLWWHGFFAYTIIALIAIHIGAAFFHHLVKRDNVLRRMLPNLKPRT